MSEFVSTTHGVRYLTGYQKPTGPDGELVQNVQREIDNVTGIYRVDNLHTVIAERIIAMVRQFDKSAGSDFPAGGVGGAG